MELRTKAQQNLLISQGFDVLLRDQDVEKARCGRVASAFVCFPSPQFLCLFPALSTSPFSPAFVLLVCFLVVFFYFHLPSHNLLLICSYTLTLLKSSRETSSIPLCSEPLKPSPQTAVKISNINPHTHSQISAE